jgi:hypothetical protein
MTSWKTAPVINDSVAIFDEGASIGMTDDVWRMTKITAVSLVTGDLNNNGCPSSTKLVQAADLTVSNPSYHVTVSPAIPATVLQGASVRFFRHVHYSLWKWATDGQWYLAYYVCLPPGGCGAAQPIAGPLRPYAAPGTTSGLEFTYYDSTGAITANKTLVARIRVVVRGQGTSTINLTGAAAMPLRDSLRVEIGLRNRN